MKKHFLYYIPGMESPTPQDIINAGLRHAFDGQREISCQCQGPDNETHGAILYDGRVKPNDIRDVHYNPATQTWQQIPGRTAWIGWVTGQIPGPEDLERGEMLDGHLVEMADERKWLCPVARGLIPSDETLQWTCELEEKIGLDKDGKIIVDGVIPKYQKLWALADTYWNVLNGAITETDDEGVALFEMENVTQSAIQCLTTNYRIDLCEMDVLGLFSIKTPAKILEALVDWPTFEKWGKKKATESDQAAPDG